VGVAQQLEGNLALELPVERAVDGARTAGAERAAHFEPANVH
jgi:hypothetical protein